MERNEGERNWLEELLSGAGIDPSRLACAQSSRRPVVERNNPWQDADGIEEASRILGAARGGGKNPAQILVVTDIDDDPIARVQAAVQLARAALARGTDVLLVDADIRHVGLSRWLQDRDLDSEGLVDVLQYGASVAAARRASSLDGIDVLGVGSYRPDVGSIFTEDDLRRLHAQLRSSANLVIVVAPAYLADGRFQPMLREADSVVLSMHLDRGLSDSLGELLAHLGQCELPLGGVFLWAGPDDSERFVDDALLERSRVLPRMEAASPFPGRRPEPGEPVAEEESGSHATAPIPAAHEPDEPDPVDEGPSSVRISTERPRPGARRARSGSASSGLVRTVMSVIALGLVAFIVWWAVTWKSVEPTRPRIQPPDRPDASGPVAAGGAVDADVDTAKVAAALPGGGPEAPSDADPAPAGEETAEDATMAGVGRGTDAVQTSRDVEGILAAPVENAPGLAVEDDPVSGPVADPFEAGLRRQDGGDWALHLSSFTTEAEANAERAGLERQGYSAVVRPAVVKGRQWYRVLVGRFDTRAAAAEFREKAQEKFRSDWVGVVKR